MEVQMSPAPQFNGNNQTMIRPSASSPYEPTSKRFKSDLTFQCIVCSDVYDDPNILYEHMKMKHQVKNRLFWELKYESFVWPQKKIHVLHSFL